MHLPQDKVCGIFRGQRPGCRRAFLQGRDDLGGVEGLVAGVIADVSPGAVPGETAIAHTIGKGFLTRTQKRKRGAGDDGHVAAVDQLQHA